VPGVAGGGEEAERDMAADCTPGGAGVETFLVSSGVFGRSIVWV
jgi:hypothetical protein